MKLAHAIVSSVALVCLALIIACRQPQDALESSAAAPAPDYRGRYVGLCAAYSGTIDADGWCRGAKPAVSSRVLVEIQIAEAEPICLDLDVGTPSRAVNVGDTVVAVVVLPPYSPCGPRLGVAP